MATTNPFDLLGDDDAEDPSQLIAAKHAAAVLSRKGSDHPQGKQAAAAAKQNKPANLPSKPLPPAQAGQFLRFLIASFGLWKCRVDLDD